MKNAKQMLDHLAEFAAKMFSDTGELQPMWILESQTEVVPIVAPFDCDATKDAASEFVRAKAKEIKAEVSGFMAEAWVVEADKDTVINVMPRNHEDRREVIHIYAEDKSGTQLMGHYYILRPEHGKAKLSPFKQMEGSASGRFTSMLEKT